MNVEAEPLELRPDGAGLVLRVRVVPRASRDAVEGVRDGALLVRLTAPPVDGKANEALVRLLARALGIQRRAVVVVAGARARDKRLRIDGVDAATLRRLAQPDPERAATRRAPGTPEA